MSDEEAVPVEKGNVEVKEAEPRGIGGFNHDQNVRLAIESGKVGDRRPLVGFLYDLLRDHVQPGTVEGMVRRQFEPHNPFDDKIDSYSFTNGWLAKYAQDIAARLTKEDSLHTAFVDAADQAGLAQVPMCKGWRKGTAVDAKSDPVLPPVYVYLEFRIERQADLVVVTATGEAKDVTLPNTASVTVPPMRFEKVEGELLAIERVDWLIRNIMDKAYDAAEQWFRNYLKEKPNVLPAP